MRSAVNHMARLLTGIEIYAGALATSRIDPLLGPATLSVGRIEGGSSANTVPDRLLPFASEAKFACA